MCGADHTKGQLILPKIVPESTGLANHVCYPYDTRMLNLISWLIGLFCLILAIPLLIPVVGILLWILLPICGVGILIGALSSKDSGRNFNILVFVLIIMRLSIFGGMA